MTDRRSFLRILGMAPAAPFAVKAAADKAAAELIGISAVPTGTPPGAYLGGAIGNSPDNTGAWKAKVLRFISGKKLPDWFEDEVRNRNRVVSYIDPDIACKRSWSLNVKIATQRERNIERAKLEAIEGPSRSLRSREFEEQFGVWI